MLFQISKVVAVLGLAVGIVTGQQTSPWTDPASNVTYQRFFVPAQNLSFGIVLPTTPTNEFIGQLVAPRTGWTGLSLGAGMLNNLLLTTWFYNNGVLRQFRLTTGFMSPPAYNPSASGIRPNLTTICGTSTNSTHYIITFTCQDCNKWTVQGRQAGFELTAAQTTFGYARGTTNPTNPANAASDLQKHNMAGRFMVNLQGARNANYTVWRNAVCPAMRP